MNRSQFLKTSALGTVGMSMGLPGLGFSTPRNEFTSLRPPENKRNFISKAVENLIQEVKGDIADPELAWMFENCYPNTLDTTVQYDEIDGKPDTFVITGDIHAMWLRDSAAQVWPYLPLTKKDKKLRKLIEGVVRRQTQCILIDPYANAFNRDASTEHQPWAGDMTDMKPELHERKWEIDSLCYPVRLAYGYWKTTGDDSVFDKDWKQAAALTLQTFKEQQRKDDLGPYTFQRRTSRSSDTTWLRGYGLPTKKVGLIHSMFRPSDDATVYPFLIPSNLFAVVSLRQLAEIHEQVLKDGNSAKQFADLADEVEEAVMEFGVATHPVHGPIFAFEVDGFGNALFMDDSNVPSLISLPYLDAVDRDALIYRKTRAFVLFDSNPFFHRGNYAEGVGGPHINVNMIWPMSLIMRAMTSTEKNEITQNLKWLKATHGDTGFMHESFHKDDPKNFTRHWFAWANTLFGELIVKIHQEHPELLKQTL